jgi:transcriptional regulator with XRE-family HTH domain
MDHEFPADRYIRAARKLADFSQRDLASRAGIPYSIVARVESAPERARVGDFALLLRAAGLRMQVVDDSGREIAPERRELAGLTDRARRRYPAHLDVRPGKSGWWGDGWPMFDGKAPVNTFDRSRGLRDWRRERRGIEARRAEECVAEMRRAAEPDVHQQEPDVHQYEAEVREPEAAVREPELPDEVSRDELGDLNRVQGGALAEVVVTDEQNESAIAVDTGVLPNAADETGIRSGGQQWSGDVGDFDPGRSGEEFDGAGDGQGASELGVDRQRVSGEDRYPDARPRDD